ncbi:MAG: hypothetical protein IKI33_03275, partial [Eubacterium sp.]|nr:hypothetical protein [Eubacterium sp.]
YPKKGYPTYISYHLENFKEDERFEISNSISKTINDRLFSDEQFKVGITVENDMDRSNLKWKYGNWIVDYSVSYVK